MLLLVALLTLIILPFLGTLTGDAVLGLYSPVSDYRKGRLKGHLGDAHPYLSQMKMYRIV